MSDLKLNTPLTAKEIDFRVQSINKGGYATILAYKDARVDMNRLDAVYGAGYWQRKHELINGKEFCSIGVWNKELAQWVWLQDCGTKSNTEAAKGETSDSFKRAGFNLGIGRELYDYPIIQIKLNQDEFTVENNKAKATWNLKLKEWKWATEFNSDGEIIAIAAKDQNNQMRHKWGEFTKQEKAQ